MQEDAAAERRHQLQGNLRRVRERIDGACRAAGRADTPTLIVVTKTHPARDVAALVRMGVADVGENRDQEARAKAELTASLVEAQPRWHFIGQLQSKKAASVLGYAHAIHSVDRPALVQALGKRLAKDREDGPGRSEPVELFLQVDLRSVDSAHAVDGRGGAAVADLVPLGEQVARLPGARLMGLMTVLPQTGEKRRWFEELSRIHGKFMEAFPSARSLSAGMSGDFEQAVAFGATHIRVGSDVLGNRPANR